jgi:hypothetical protein
MSRKPKPSKFWTPERLRYWRDFDQGQRLAGTTGAYIYAGVRKLMRAERLAKAKKAKRRRAA